MKKLCILFTCAIIFFFSCKTKNRTEDNKEVKVGIILPLTGSAAVWGQNALEGIQLAQRELENKGIGLSLIVEDSKSQTKEAVTALEKLIVSEKISVVIGDIASSSVLAMAPIAERNEVVLLSPGASNPDISNSGEYIFRNWQSDALEGEIGAEFVFRTLKIDKAAILYVNNAYGTGLKKSFENSFKKLGGETTIAVGFNQDATDLRTQLLKLKNEQINLIYMPGFPNEMSIALKQAKEIGLNKQFISTQSFDDPIIIEIAKSSADGVIYSVPKPPDTTNSIVKLFKKNYSEMHSSEPGVCSDTGYDALNIIADAISKGLKSGPEFKSFLNNLENYPGAAGLTTFDKKGDVVKSFIFKKIQNKRAVILDYEK